MKKQKSRLLLTAGLLFVTFAVIMTGCNLSSSGATNVRKTQISFKTSTSGSSVTVSPGAATGTNTATVASTSPITIDTAKVLIKKLEFHSVSGDSMDFEKGPFVLNLNMDSTAVTKVAVSNIPNGSYDDISFHIHKADPEDSTIAPAFVTGPLEYQHYSIIVKGIYKGTYFVFRSPVNAEINVKLNPPLTVSDSLSSYNATVQVDVSKWFTGPNGTVLDPTNPKDAWAIDMAIRHSFNGFDDNNRDGHNDHTEGMMGHDHHNHQGNNGGDH